MDNSTALTIALFVAGTILTIFGFFLRTAYNDTRKDIELLMQNDSKASEELGKLKGSTTRKSVEISSYTRIDSA
jgi:hypothetical protein